MDYGIYYRTTGDGKLLGLTNNDCVGEDMEDKKSALNHVFLMSSSVVSWCSKK